jgi:hypothetical protein
VNPAPARGPYGLTRDRSEGSFKRPLQYLQILRRWASQQSALGDDAGQMAGRAPASRDCLHQPGGKSTAAIQGRSGPCSPRGRSLHRTAYCVLHAACSVYEGVAPRPSAAWSRLRFAEPAHATAEEGKRAELCTAGWRRAKLSLGARWRRSCGTI